MWQNYRLRHGKASKQRRGFKKNRHKIWSRKKAKSQPLTEDENSECMHKKIAVAGYKKAAFPDKEGRRCKQNDYLQFLEYVAFTASPASTSAA